jgi:hypothetical protein
MCRLRLKLLDMTQSASLFISMSVTAADSCSSETETLTNLITGTFNSSSIAEFWLTSFCLQGDER